MTTPGNRALLIIGLAVAANVLIFVRVAVLFSPAYSYNGPTGADPVFYYSYVRSLVIDHDLDFRDEMALHPPSTGLAIQRGRPVNKFPIGVPLLGAPGFLVAHASTVLLRSFGVPIVADGYSPAYPMAYALSLMTFAMCGIWLLYLVLLKYFSSPIAAVAVVGAWWGTNALYYSAIFLMMSHAAALFSTAWCTYEAVTLADGPDRWFKWCRLGASCALVILVRYQNGLFLIVPLAAAGPLFAAAWRQPVPALVTARRLGSAAIGFLVLLTLQLLAWKAVFGAWFVNSYERELAFAWRHPHLWEAATDPVRGFFIWLPMLVLGVAGCLGLAWSHRDPVALAAAASWMANVYVISAWWAWDSVAPRATFDMLLPVCLGLGWVLSIAGRWRPAVVALLVAMVAWSVPFAVMGRQLPGGSKSLAAVWLRDCRLFLGVRSGS
jgi:hypothetical protein